MTATAETDWQEGVTAAAGSGAESDGYVSYAHMDVVVVSCVSYPILVKTNQSAALLELIQHCAESEYIDRSHVPTLVHF